MSIGSMISFLSKHKTTHSTKMVSNAKVVLHGAFHFSYCKPEMSLFVKWCCKILEWESRTGENEAEVFGKLDLASISITHVHPDPKEQ